VTWDFKSDYGLETGFAAAAGGREMTLENWGNVANLVMALAAIAALLYAFVEVRSARDDSREATAIQTWMEYYLRCLDQPQYACPDFKKLKSSKELYKYEWFVSFMLLACDQVIRLPKGGPNWEQFVRNNVSYHSDYFNDRYFSGNYSPPFSPELISKIKEVLAEIREKKTEGA
jgi:hypothetical protein